MKITIIAAIGANRAIGKDNKLLWNIPEDMRLFRKNTLGKAVVMGRNTAASIGKALPNRRNIVVTSGDAPFEGIEVVRSFTEALNLTDIEELCVIGGARLYEVALPVATCLKLTFIEDNPQADVFFPKYDIKSNNWQQLEYLHTFETDTHPAFTYHHYVKIPEIIF